MAITERNSPKTQPIPDKAEPEAREPAQTSASEPLDRDPAEIDKTLKKDAVKVSDATPLSELDPYYGHGGAFIINEEGVRVKAE